MTKLTCERCAELEAMLRDAETNMSELGRQVAGLERNLRRAGSAEVALQQELAKLREEEPESPVVRELLQLWRDEVKGGDKRIKVTLAGPRPDRVRWAVKKYGKDRVEAAIRGVRHDDWAMGRDRRTSGREYNDVAKHILRDEETIERFERLHLNGGTHRPAARPVEGPTGVAAVLGRLECVREEKPGQWVALCPAHEDRNRSLSVAQGDKGAVVHCHAGCPADVIAGAVGLSVHALFDPDDQPAQLPVATRDSGPLPSEEEIDSMRHHLMLASDRIAGRLWELRRWDVETLRSMGLGFDGKRLWIPVRDARGGLVNVLRYSPNPARTGGPKMLAGKDRSRGLFPAPETVTGDEVWIVEGEPDAISARHLRIPAVAVPGVNGWRREWAQRFEGRRRVLVCMDCDEKGRAAASRIASDLVSVAREVRVVDLDPARDDGWDLSDVLLEGGTAAVVRDLAVSGGCVVSIGRRDAA